MLVQMRFPVMLMGKDRLLNAHNMTLLDGEMVVDEDIVTGGHTRRYLAYDLMSLNSKSLVNRPWKVPSRPPVCCGDTLSQVQTLTEGSVFTSHGMCRP
jgi:hypothetical protein